MQRKSKQQNQEHRERSEQSLKRSAHVPEERDVEILKFFLSVRFATLDDIYALLKDRFPSSYVLWRRLWKLHRLGYIAIPHKQPRLLTGKKGRGNTIYGLGTLGARALARQGCEIPKSDFDFLAREVKPFSLEHPLLSTRFITCLLLLKKNYPHLSLRSIMREPQLDDAVLIQDAKHIYEVSISPDVFFILTDPASGEALNFAVEIDRSTMPVKRTSFKQSSFYKHVVKYNEYWKKKDLKNFTVLTVTEDKDRVTAFQKLVRETATHPTLFWFTTRESLDLDHPEKILFDEVWTDGESKSGSIL